MRMSARSLLLVLALLAPPMLLSAAPVSAGPPASSEVLAQKAAAAGKLPLVVEIRPGAGPAVAQLARNAGGTEVRTFELMPYVTLTGTAATIRALAANAKVVQITEDIAVPPALNSSLAVINADDVRALGFTGVGTAVAILDTGIDADHPFFRDNNGGNPGTSRILSQACFSHDNGSNQFTLCPNGTTTDLTGANIEGLANCLNGATNMCAHGSHVAGIAAGDGAGVAGAPIAGVAPDAGIVAIQVFTRFTDPGPGGCNGPAPCVLSFASDQIAGLNRVGTLNGANPAWGIAAANLSLGGGKFGAACDGGGNAAQKTAIDTLLAAGIATVIAAGNDGFLNSVSSPGCISTAVTVGSTTDADTVSGFSNRGPLLDLFAPGSSIDSSVPDDTYANFNGTSMATPHVVGAFAVLRQAAPGRTIAQLLNDLQTTGVPITYSTGGSGTATTPRIDLLAALNAVSANLGITKACPSGPVPPTATVTCTITVTNSGPVDAQGVVVTDTPGPGLTISATPVPGGGGFTCSILGGGTSLSCTKATQPVGTTSVITYALYVGDTVSPGATLTNNAHVSATTPDSVPANNSSSASITIVACTITSNAAEVGGTAGNDVICGGPAAQDIAALAGNDVVFGSGGDDRLAGAAGDDILLGGDGNDQLAGGDGNDKLFGQAGAADYAAGGNGIDTCDAEFEGVCEI
jgi:uncharacterized repeat protein (TIGR01451 family)